MKTRVELLKQIEERGRSIDRELKLIIASLSIEEREINRFTLRDDTNVWVNFAQGFYLDDVEGRLRQTFKNLVIGTPKHGVYYERGDAPRTRGNKAIKYTRRQAHPIFQAVITRQIQLLKEELAELYGQDISNSIQINIPRIYSVANQ